MDTRSEPTDRTVRKTPRAARAVSSRVVWLLSPAILIVLVAGCRIHRVETEPAAPVELPPSFSASGSDHWPADRWWLGFEDAALNSLIDEALSQNLDLKAAWARLQQAEAVSRRARAALFPTLSTAADASRTRQTFSIGGPVGTVTNESSQFVLSLAASYEVDLWGRIASQWDAADLDALASRDDYESLAMTIAARVAETWYQLAEIRAQRELIDEQLKVSRMFLELIELRFGQGLASALDVYQQRQQVSSLESQIPPIEAAAGILEHQLAVILGTAPGGSKVPEEIELPDLPPLPATGVPAELLGRRPDLRAARTRVVAADHRLAASIADLLPTIRLSGRTGYQSPEISDLLDSWLWNIAGGVSAPLFEGGRRWAEMERSRAVVTERLQGFASTLLDAVREVEDALVRERKQEEYIEALDRQLEIANSNLREAGSRYLNGLVDYLNVLTALASSQRIERNLLTAQRELVTFRIQLCRALGGSWTGDLDPPAEVALNTGVES